jgi:hypothetical protein
MRRKLIRFWLTISGWQHLLDDLERWLKEQ